MLKFGYIIILAFLILVAVYTVSYGIWTWKRKNRFGAIMVFILSLAVIVLPTYVLLFKD